MIASPPIYCEGVTSWKLKYCGVSRVAQGWTNIHFSQKSWGLPARSTGEDYEGKEHREAWSAWEAWWIQREICEYRWKGYLLRMQLNRVESCGGYGTTDSGMSGCTGQQSNYRCIGYCWVTLTLINGQDFARFTRCSQLSLLRIVTVISWLSHSKALNKLWIQLRRVGSEILI